MKVNMDDLLLAGLLDNDDELILLSQVCSGSDVPSFEKGLHNYMVTCTSIRLRLHVQNDLATLHRTSFLLVPT